MKTPKEFEYDLFKNEEKFFVRIKKTGDIIEVSIAVFRVLRNEAMRIYRENKGVPIYKKENGKQVLKDYTSNLSIDFIKDNELQTESIWLSDNNKEENSIFLNLNLEEFKKRLTQKQLDLFQKCVIEGMNYTDYAKENDIDKSSARDRLKAIKIKAEKFF